MHFDLIESKMKMEMSKIHSFLKWQATFSNQFNFNLEKCDLIRSKLNWTEETRKGNNNNGKKKKKKWI